MEYKKSKIKDQLTLLDDGKVSLHVRLLPLHDQLVESDEGNGESEHDTLINLINLN